MAIAIEVKALTISLKFFDRKIQLVLLHSCRNARKWKDCHKEGSQRLFRDVEHSPNLYGYKYCSRGGRRGRTSCNLHTTLLS